MKGGSFQDFKPDDELKRRRDASANTTAASAGGAEGGDGNGALGPLNNYSTFFAGDPGVRTLLKSSDQIEHSKKMLNESEQTAKNVMVDLELQRSQFQDMKNMLSETGSITTQVQDLLRRMADRNFRRKVFLWFIIVVLAITDIVVFYLLFVRH